MHRRKTLLFVAAVAILGASVFVAARAPLAPTAANTAHVAQGETRTLEIKAKAQARQTNSPKVTQSPGAKAGTAKTKQKAKYHKITPEQAKKMMDDAQTFILLDVRTAEEFDEEHISGAVLIPDTEMQDRAKKELPDKNAFILVYCRSGRRSASAAKALVKMGYTNVYDFGGIIDWPYDTVGGI